MNAIHRQRKVLAIVGGGFTGAAVAYHLARNNVLIDIIIFEPRAILGAGLAYDTDDIVYRINVPAGRMTLLPGEDAHFADWLERDGWLARDQEAFHGGVAYPPRQVFGRYVEEQLAPFVQSGQVRHVREKVIGATRTHKGWRLKTDADQLYEADLLTVATTHPKPAIPRELQPVAGDFRVVTDGLASGVLNSIGPDERVFIIGSGLTAADIVASLDKRGHRGSITLLSRRGQRSRGHAPQAFESEGDFTTHPSVSALQLLKAVRQAVAKAETEGRSWHPVLDAVRAQGDTIWNALHPKERQRLVRHLRPFWDAHRFRIAPQIDAVLDRKFADGSLELVKGSLKQVEKVGDGFQVTLLDRRRNRIVTQSPDRIIVTTGPAHGDILRQQSYLGELAEIGQVKLDSAGLGLATSRNGRALDERDHEVETLFVAGPLARGTFGELMGLPQVSDYALFISNQILTHLQLTGVESTQNGLASTK